MANNNVNYSILINVEYGKKLCINYEYSSVKVITESKLCNPMEIVETIETTETIEWELIEDF
jgi:hypothetical protein